MHHRVIPVDRVPAAADSTTARGSPSRRWCQHHQTSIQPPPSCNPVPYERAMALCRPCRPLLVLLAAAPLAAQWVPVPALNAPPSRSGFTLTPLPNGEMLLFGGDINNPAATEWSWSGISWTPVTTPVPRR